MLKAEKYLSFYFFKSTASFNSLPQSDREKLANSFKNLLSSLRENNGFDVRLYSCKGYRKDTDFLVWLIADSFEAPNTFCSLLEKQFLGYFEISYVFHSMTRPSPYFRQERPQSFESGPSKFKYIFVYPFCKTHEWYQLPQEQRTEIMKEHRVVATKFDRVFTNTAYAFGLGDDEFMLAFETDYPKDFADLLIALRDTKARPYTKYDIPIIPCINKPESKIITEIFAL